MVKTVLIIDDDKSIQKFLSMALVKDGYKVLTSENGIDGISTFYNNMTDMILLDLALPDFDGIKVLDALRNQPISLLLSFQNGTLKMKRFWRLTAVRTIT